MSNTILTVKELASLVLTLFSKIAANPSIRDAMNERESVRNASVALLNAVQDVYLNKEITIA